MPEEAQPINYKTIMKYQQKDNNLIKTAKCNTNYQIKQLGKSNLFSEIVIPKQLQRHIVDLYNLMLSHPGETYSVIGKAMLVWTQ